MVDLMTQASPVTRTVTFRARAGHGQALAERLLHAAALVAEAPGCELWLVHRDQDDADIIRVSEMWAGGTGSKCSPSGRMSRAMARWSAIGLRHE